MQLTPRRLTALVLLAGLPAVAGAQSLPTSQPNFLQIYREQVKTGRADDHARIESGWPAAYEKAKSPYFYLGLVSMSGPNEAWFVTPFESFAAMAEILKSEEAPALAGELSRLSRMDAEVLDGIRTIQARARKDLSYGAYPDTGKERFWEITVMRVRPGSEEAFAAAAKAYGAAVGRAGAPMSWRVYEVMAGMPGPTYMIFSSMAALADLDKMMAAEGPIVKAMTPDDIKVFEKFNQGLISAETNRFRLSPAMSYVPKATKDQDPAFWAK